MSSKLSSLLMTSQKAFVENISKLESLLDIHQAKHNARLKAEPHA